MQRHKSKDTVVTASTGRISPGRATIQGVSWTNDRAIGQLLIAPAPECFEQMMSIARITLKNSREQHNAARCAPVEPLLGLDFCGVLGDALCAERGLARRL